MTRAVFVRFVLFVVDNSFQHFPQLRLNLLLAELRGTVQMHPPTPKLWEASAESTHVR